MTKIVRLPALVSFCLITLAILPIAGCSWFNREEEPPPPASALPPAPPTPSFVRLSVTAPPADRDEVPPMLQDPVHDAWKPGYWSYTGGQFTWVPGAIITKPDMTAVWVLDHWEKREYGWAFVAGFWQ